MELERQELYCTECERYVQFSLDIALNGNHVLDCPNCGHTHYRVVRDGKITDIRFNPMSGATIYVNMTSATTSAVSTWTTASTSSSTTGGVFLYGAWMNTTNG